MNALTPGHLAVVAVVVVLLFGAKKLPDAARSLGKSLRIFKAEVRELQNEGRPQTSEPQTAPPAQVESQRVDPVARPPEQDHGDARPA